MVELSFAEILFEGVENYTPDKFALARKDTGAEKALVLVDKAIYLTGNIPASIAAYGATKAHTAERCDGAAEINFIVANKNYQKAGYTMYCCMSNVFGYITSDRLTSSTNPSKKTWARIEWDSD